jgi:N-succinyldiaminopimelate aminotransferase
MHSRLARLQPYPFERLGALLEGLVPPHDLSPIRLSIGEPSHAIPDIIVNALHSHSHDWSVYPTTRGLGGLREAIAGWLCRRFALPADAVNPDSHVLPVNGTREALFAFAQVMVDASTDSRVLMPNPFYQIYEGAALLAGAEPYYLPLLKENGYIPDYASVPDEVWAECSLLYLCSPGNPAGTLHDSSHYRQLLALAERHDFVIASDECYSELYNDDEVPPTGLLQAAHAMGNTTFRRCMVFHSLSKRSNAPGMRSGFVAGDATLIAAFLKYRTYHGCAMSLPVQYASTVAWQDESHVIENRQLYQEKFRIFTDILGEAIQVVVPPAGFYLWLETPVADTLFASCLYEEQFVTVLPGRFLSREVQGLDPGVDHVRIALVASVAECEEAALRIRSFVESL